MKVLLYHLDGKHPNLALMRLAHHFKGEDVELRRVRKEVDIERQLWDSGEETVYASLIFDRTKPRAERFQKIWPQAIIGGTGWNLTTTLETEGIVSEQLDYSIYPKFKPSIGFSQRGCRLKCSFCVVPKKEGNIFEVNTINEIWRGGDHPKQIILLDNDFFGQDHWRERIAEIRDGGFKVNFNQGINVRVIGDEEAEAIASVDYRNTKMERKSIYAAWDNNGDEKRVFRGLKKLVEAGVKPRHITIYMLVGYEPYKQTMEGNIYRAKKLREFGAMPYPMPFHRTRELVGFQRWIIGAYDKRIPWEDWERAGYRPEHL